MTYSHAHQRFVSRNRSLAILTLCVTVVLTALTGCEMKPQTRTQTFNTYELVPLASSKLIQKKSGLIIEEKGEAKDALQPVKIQACDGPYLAYDIKRYKDKYGRIHEKKNPVYVTVSPIQGTHVRRIKLTNNTKHVLRFDRMVAVLVDGAGNEREFQTKELLEQGIRAKFQCQSGQILVNSLQSMKTITASSRILPGRTWEGMLAFSNVDLSVRGDWFLQLIDVPVKADQAGNVTKRTTFEFQMTVEHFRTVVVERKENLFKPWTEVSRETNRIN